MELIEFGVLSDAQRTQLEGDEVDPWDSARNDLTTWRPKDRHVGLIDGEGRLVAAAGLVAGAVRGDDGRTVGVLGIGGVIVAAPYRGRGLARRVVEASLERAGDLELAMLFCYRDRAGLYERLDFRELGAKLLVEQPEGPVEMPLVTMWRPLRDGASLPEGPLTLDGTPF